MTKERKFSKELSHERIGHILAGTGILFCTVMGMWINAWFFAGSILICLNLIQSGFTNTCGVKDLLIKLGIPGEREIGKEMGYKQGFEERSGFQYPLLINRADVSLIGGSSMDHKKQHTDRRASNITQRLQQISERKGLSHEEGEIKVRPVENSKEMDEVYRIVHDAYLERGYIEKQPNGKLIHYPHLDRIPETTVLVALEDGEIVGTNSITLDSPNGLHTDGDFKEECDHIRSENRMLASSWRIATKKSCRNERKAVMELIQETIDQALGNGVETMLFTFNPRHERIYKKLLNMTTIARDDGSISGLSNAPAVLMRADAENLPARWLKNRPELQQEKYLAVS